MIIQIPVGLLDVSGIILRIDDGTEYSFLDAKYDQPLSWIELYQQ